MSKELRSYTSAAQDRELDVLESLIDDLDVSDDTKKKLQAALARIFELADKAVKEAYNDGYSDAEPEDAE